MDKTPKISKVFSKLLPAKVVSFSLSGVSMYFSKRLADGAVSSSSGLNPNFITVPVSLLAVLIASKESKSKNAVLLGGIAGILATLLQSEEAENPVFDIDENNTFVLFDNEIFFVGSPVSLDDMVIIAKELTKSGTRPELLVLSSSITDGFFEEVTSALSALDIEFGEAIVTSSNIDNPFDKKDFTVLVKNKGFKDMVQAGVFTLEMGN